MQPLKKTKNSNTSLSHQIQSARERMEDLEDLLELRAALERNGNKPGIPWEKVKAELDSD